MPREFRAVSRECRIFSAMRPTGSSTLSIRPGTQYLYPARSIEENCMQRRIILWIILAILLTSITLAAPDVTTELLTEPLAGIAYTPDCLVECHLPLRLVFGEDYTVSVPADFAANLTEGTGDYGFETIVFKMLVNVTEQRSRWVPNLQCSPFEEPVDNGTLTVENCTDLGHEENDSVDVRQWQPFDPLGFTFNAGEPYVVDLVGTRKAQLGDAGVDAHFCFGNVCTEEFAWWDSTYVYRYNLTFSRSCRRAEPQAGDVSTLNGSLRCLRVVQDDSTELPWEWWHENRQAPLVDDTIRFFADADRKSTRLNSSHMSISYAV